MRYYDNTGTSIEEDDKDAEALAPAPVGAPAPTALSDDDLKARVRDNIMQKYKIASDNSGVTAAQAGAKRTNTIATLLEGLGQMATAGSVARGGAGVKVGQLNGMRDQANREVEQAQQARKEQMEGVLQNDKLGWQDEQRGQERKDWDRKTVTQGYEDTNQARKGVEQDQKDKEFGWKSDFNDPNSVASIKGRDVFAKKYHVDPSQLEGMSFAQMKELALKSDSAPKGARSVQTVEVPDGKGGTRVELVWADPNSMTLTPTGQVKGYKHTYDGTTGTTISGSDSNAPAVPVLGTDGVPQSTTRTKLEGERAGVKTTATAEAKDVQKAEEAEAKGETFGTKSARWTDLYNKARTEPQLGGLTNSSVGPVGGRVTKFKNEHNISAGPAADALNTALTTDANQYIKDMTGSQMSEGEAKRLLAARPSIDMEPELFQTKIKETQQLLDDIVSERRSAAHMPKTAGASPAPVAAAAPAPQGKQYTPEQESTISAYMKQYPERSRKDIIKAMGL